MMQPWDELPGQVWRWLQTRMRALLPEGLPPRLLLLFLLLAAHAAADGMSWLFEEMAGRLFIVSMVLIRMGIAAAVLFAAHPVADQVLNRLRLRLAGPAQVVAVVMMLVTLAAGVAFLQNCGSPSYYGNDAIILNHHAYELLIEGYNPYNSSSIVVALDTYRLSSTQTTPLRQGSFARVFPYPSSGQLDWALGLAKARGDALPIEFESKISYPAGSFLLPAPFLAIGMPELRLFYLMCAIAICVALYRGSPPALRPMALVLIVANAGLWSQVIGGTIDTLYMLFLFLGWTTRRRPWLSGLLVGLACTSKQIAWFYAIFYGILVLRESGLKRSLAWLSTAAAVFLATNLPFILADANAWLAGISSPLADPMFPMGVGLVIFSSLGLVPVQSPLVYAALEAVVMVGCLAWYWRRCLACPQAGLVLATVPLFLAWRSLPSYFFPVPFLVLGAVLVEEYRGAEVTVEVPAPAEVSVERRARRA